MLDALRFGQEILQEVYLAAPRSRHFICSIISIDQSINLYKSHLTQQHLSFNSFKIAHNPNNAFVNSRQRTLSA